jgi:hypothetical protein
VRAETHFIAPLRGGNAMRSNDVPFARLRALLLDLGFIERTIDGKYLAFYHADSDTLFTFHLYRPQERVTAMDLTGVSKQLDWRGLLSEEAFENALRKVSA